MDIAGSFGSGLRGAVVDASGQILDQKESMTPRSSEGALVDAIVTMATRLRDLAQRDGQGPTAMGLAIPGPVDEMTGVIRRGASFLVWSDLPLARIVEQRVGLPAVLVQDVRAGARAERLGGAGRGVNDMLLVVIGTGVGAAVICGGQPVRGAFGNAGEIGHIEVDVTGGPCSCGGRGCLETFISEQGIASRYALAAGQAISANEVVSRAARGDAAALKVWNAALRALAMVTGSAVALVECELVVLSGTMTIPDAPLRPLGATWVGGSTSCTHRGWFGATSEPWPAFWELRKPHSRELACPTSHAPVMSQAERGGLSPVEAAEGVTRRASKRSSRRARAIPMGAACRPGPTWLSRVWRAPSLVSGPGVCDFAPSSAQPLRFSPGISMRAGGDGSGRAADQ